MKRDTLRPGDRGLVRSLNRSGTRSDRRPPVLHRNPAPPEGSRCERCGAEFAHSTWRNAGRGGPASIPAAHRTVCPACRQVREGEYFGRVLARGPFALAHEEELRHRILNVIRRARFTQPERRLVQMERQGDLIEVLVTSQKLAHRIVRELEKAFGGHGHYEWSDHDGELLGTWQREDPEPAPAGRRA